MTPTATAIANALVDVPGVRGCIPMPNGDTAIVFTGDIVLVARNPYIMSEFVAQSFFEGQDMALRDAATALQALPGAWQGQTPKQEAESMKQHREIAELGRGRKKVVIDGDMPEFMPGQGFVGCASESELQRRAARDDKLRMEVPEV